MPLSLPGPRCPPTASLADQGTTLGERGEYDMPGCHCGCGHTGGAYQRPCSVPGGCGSVGCDGYGNLPEDGPPPTCALCGRKRPVPDRVCAKCRKRVQEWIADLPSLYRRLDVELVPG